MMTALSVLTNSSIATAALTYLSVAASPGPSNLAIVAMAATRGRRLALFLAAGVFSGSAFWACMTTSGLAQLLLRWPVILNLLKTFGSLYLFWLAWSAWQAASRPLLLVTDASAAESALPTYRQGLLMHLTNPKAIMAWTSVLILADPVQGEAPVDWHLTGFCLLLGAGVFVSYAFIFSNPSVREWFIRSAAQVYRVLTLVFAVAGVELLLSIP